MIVKINAPTLKVGFDTPIIRDYVDCEPYEGSYEVTPSSEPQILQTTDKRMTGDLVVNPIPSNYGKISWNGRVITIT